MDENNNNIQKPNNSRLKQFFSKLIDKDGFYIILFICISIVATTAVWVSQNNIKKLEIIQEDNSMELVEDLETDEDLETNEDVLMIDNTEENTSDLKILEVVEKENEVSKGTEEKEKQNTKETNKEQKIKDTKTSEKAEDKAKTVETSVQATVKTKQEILRGMVVPLIGKITLDYAEDKLVYSKTLEQWTTHKGIDISAREGSAVRAALDGIVSQIKNDSQLGIVIVLDHGNGIKTKYGCLSTDSMVKVGQKVKKGDTISGVGEGTGYELAEGPHLHFEVIIDGKNVDPKGYLPKID